jgi:hypothetical protein
VFYFQKKCGDSQGTEFHGTTHSGATDVPVAEEEGSTDGKELKDGGTCN